jgi:RNA polymerase sigma factor (sigma-70 family)
LSRSEAEPGEDAGRVSLSPPFLVLHYGGGVARETLEDLVARYLGEGDEEAAEEVVRRTRPKLLAVGRRIGSPQDAEDAVHTAYLSLLHKRGGALDAPVMPWLVTAVVRIAYRHKAQEQRRTDVYRRLAQVVSTTSPAGTAAQREEIRRLLRSVDRLPGKYRDPVVLHYLQGLTTKEVAALLGISQAAVKKRLQRARTLLLGALSPWVVYPLLAGPWLLADVARASGIPTFVSTGGMMNAKSVVVVASVAVAAGTAGFGAAVVTRARTAPMQRRAVSERAHAAAYTSTSVALLDQVARLEKRARFLEEENRALRTNHNVEPVPVQGPQRVGRTPAPPKDDTDLVKRWQARLRDDPTLEILKQGVEVLRKTNNYSAVERVYREQLRAIDEASAEGRFVLMQLGYLHRGEADYRKSDESFRRLQNVTSPQDPEFAEATFHLAWNRRFEEDWEAAVKLFDDASRLPGATKRTAAVSRFNIAVIQEDTGKTAQAKSEYAAIAREYAGDPSGIVRCYVELARKRLAAFE